ncbi:MAG: HD domain-containing protein, partial [Candidatus Omnitrophica bacterium]|nr:HD domain-containing protein [Candidatus Omnitrophota bacterium]
YLVKIIKLTQKIRESLFKKIDREMILELTKDGSEVAQLAKAFGDILQRLEDNIKELEETRRKFYDILSKVGKALTSIDNFDSLIHLILETTVEALDVEKGVFFVAQENGTFQLKSSVGLEDTSLDKVLKESASFTELVTKEKKIVFLPSLEKEEEKKIFVYPLVCAPLIYHDKLWGVLCLSGRKRQNNFTDDELRIISHLSYQLAVAFENMKLNKDMERTYFETIAALALAVEAKDPYSRGHSERVGRYAVKLARELGLSEEDIHTLQDASRLHDIGKIGITDILLKKEGELSPQEREILRKHSTIGESIVKPLKTFQHLLEPIRHHHEYLDGSGYPDGIKGDQIPLITRILTVADIFDALTTDRPYRKAKSFSEAKKDLQDLVEKGKIDKKVVDTLFVLIEEGRL